MAFKPVDQKIDFPAMERQVLAWWDKNGIVKKYLHRNDASTKRFSFLDGPITANNPMGVHHAWGRTYKDLWQRYFNMKGYRQRFQNGFDCQGLWVEVGVEKELGFKSKKEIEKFGIAKFTNTCKARVNTYAQKQTEQTKRLGNFMDWDHSYYTMSETNNLYIWRFLKICHERGLIYKSKSATTWCPRCETGLSRHEQADSYKDITDTAVYIKFKLKNRPREYFLVWTTTPWTVSANVLLAINPEHQYVKVRSGNEFYYLAKESADRLGFNNYSTLPADKLLNLEYESVYDIPAQKGIKHYVVEWELVSPAEGTGVVHIAPGCGEEDFELGKKLQAPALSPLNEAGIFTDGYGDLTGEYAHGVTDKVVDYLKSKGSLFKTESCTHSYPHCWRCKTKCLFRLEENWFINCQKIKPGLKEAANKAKWIPSFVAKRMQNWLDNMGDWMISRKRYYGLALPFYECQKCGQLTILGSKKELKKLAINPGWVDKLPSLHRPWIDEVKIKCPRCGETTSRVKEVGDCWLDAGVVPFSTLKYFEDKKYWEEWFPADFICEMVEQVRLWYYSMLVYGYIFEGDVPYRAVLNSAEVRDEKGERMSKTKGNGIPFDEAVEKIGADVMRWLYVTQNPEINLNFGYHIADEVRRRFHLMFWNIYNFFITYANIDKFQRRKGVRVQSRHILDQWIMSRLNQLVKSVTKSLDSYDAYTASRAIEDFVADLSTWYLRRSRDRVGPTVPAGPDKDSCYETLWEVLVSLCQLLAPFTPFLTEEIYKNLTDEESVHLSNWPTVGKIDEELEKEMQLAREICEQGHAARKTAGIKVRQPLQKFSIFNFQFSITEALVQLIKEELNVKKVIFKPGKEEMKVEFDLTLTPELIAEGKARDLVREIQGLRKRSNCRLDQKIKVYGQNWPQEPKLQDYIKKETLATDLLVGPEFKLVV